ncbi:MAG: hypothetical protein HRT58_06535 [Crocinitomicaceae bacterium]|nr:hypothetical protein [Flavobacteriales bacterium]NQZ35302.1 hypothetical protein [Crocinitomicaceae bacterium]
MNKAFSIVLVAIGSIILLSSINSLTAVSNKIREFGESGYTVTSILVSLILPIIGLTLFIIGMMAIRKKSKEDEKNGIF